MEIPPQWHTNFMVYGAKKGKATHFNNIDKSLRRLLRAIGGIAASRRFCEIGGGRPLSFPVGYNKKTVLANSCRYRT
jgi:ribosomal protein L44E